MRDFDACMADLEKRREALLDGMLADVPFDGWRTATLHRAAHRVGASADEADLAFPGGMAEIARYWSARSDRRMLERLADLPMQEMRVRDRVATAVRVRIEVNAHHRETLRRLMGWLAIPTNVPVALSNTARTVNEMWYAAGDRSADWNYYTKRGLLAPVYTTSVLYWLADEADEDGDFPDTWAYIDRRIEGVLKTFGLPRRFGAWLTAKGLPESLSTVCTRRKRA